MPLVPAKLKKRREPEALRRGKEFHRRVQAEWTVTAEGTVCLERTIRLGLGGRPGVRQRRGRIDVFVDQIDDFVTVVEIKATDWDRVKARNRKKLLSAHRRQVMKYVDKYIDQDHLWVCAGIIYPRPPRTGELRRQVEEYLNEHALQVVWFDE